MNQDAYPTIYAAIFSTILCAGICVFVKRHLKQRNDYSFKYSRIILLVLLSLLCGSPFVFLIWFLWPIESNVTQFLPLMALFAATYGPWIILFLAGHRIKMNKPKRTSSTDEIFDIVNDRDEVIGQELRREVHRLGLKHRAVHVLVFNRRGELFLQKRSMSKDTFPGTWDSSSSGHVDAGEDYDACAVRELREEIGLVVQHAPERLFRIEAGADTGQEFVWVYRLEAEGPFTLHPEEIETGGWFAPEKITSWMTERPDEFARAFRLIWKMWIEKSRVDRSR
jgi:isopentenyldiphosphate isomerase